jgi:hypothetical protein
VTARAGFTVQDLQQVVNFLRVLKNLNSSNSFLCYATGRENEAFLKDLEAGSNFPSFIFKVQITRFPSKIKENTQNN